MTKVGSSILTVADVYNATSARRLRALEEENRQLSSVVQSLIEDFNVIRGASGRTVGYRELFSPTD